MEKYELSLNDIEHNYFHFTYKSKLESIEKLGLIPRIGFHPNSLEVTKKVFLLKD